MPVTIPRNIKKPKTPLGGIGAERQTRRAHSLVIDDRLLSKQYITSRVDSKVSNDAYGGSCNMSATQVCRIHDPYGGSYNMSATQLCRTHDAYGGSYSMSATQVCRIHDAYGGSCNMSAT